MFLLVVGFIKYLCEWIGLLSDYHNNTYVNADIWLNTDGKLLPTDCYMELHVAVMCRSFYPKSQDCTEVNLCRIAAKYHSDSGR